MRFHLTLAALAAIAVASEEVDKRWITTVYDVGGDCQDAHYTTLPLDVAQTTKTVTTTLPLTTTISVYPGFRRAATAEPVITAAPLAERDSGTIVHSWVCTKTDTTTFADYSEITIKGSTATQTATAYIATATYTLCVGNNICIG